MFVMLPAGAIEDITIKKNETLSLADCVAIAINNSPIIKRYEYELNIAKSNVGIAKAAFFPTINANAGIYQDYNSNKHYNGSSNRELPSAAVAINQLIWNFGKANSLIRMERFYKIAAEYRFMDSICNTIYDVKLKYFAVLKAKAVLDIEQSNLLINEEHYKRAKNLYEKKNISKVDYINAQVFLSEAKIRLLEAQNVYALARADLGNSLYLAYAPDFQIKDMENYKKKIPFTMEQSFEIAYGNSPDLWVLESTLQAMQQAVVYVKRQYYPDLSGNVGYGFNNTREYSNSNLNLYINLNSSLNVKQLKQEIDNAQAHANIAENDINLFKQNLYFEVKRYYLSAVKSSQQIPIAQEKAAQARENFELENAGYSAGKTDYVVFQLARQNYIDAKYAYVKSVYDYNVSLADLEIATHYHLDDLHQQAEHALHYHYKEIISQLESVLRCEHKHDEEVHDKAPHKHDH
jgi:outer membrane protein TolC